MAYGYMMEICAILSHNHLLIKLYNELVPLIKSCITKDKNLEQLADFLNLFSKFLVIDESFNEFGEHVALTFEKNEKLITYNFTYLYHVIGKVLI